MSLRLRLFLLLAALVCGLVATQIALVRTLAEQLGDDVRAVAIGVGQEILAGFHFEGEGKPVAVGSGERSHLFVFRTTGAHAGDGESAPPPPGEGGEADAPAGSAAEPPVRWVVRREMTWSESESAPGVTKFERQIDVQVLPPGVPPRVGEGQGDGPAAGAGPAAALRLEPGREPDVLFLRGPAAARSIQIPRAPVTGTLEAFRSRLVAGSLAVAALGLVAAAFVAHRATRPLAALATAARRVGEGELGVEVPGARHDEIGAAVASFNRMSHRLAELDRENRRLAESERLSELSEVARGLAHTLRNPLNALGFSVEELAARAPEDTAAAELVESSRRQIRRIDGALRSFLALASAGAAASERVEVGTLAREVALEALQDGGGRVRVEVEAAEPVVLDAVPAEVKAMLQALVVNAVEASPDAARVTVRVRPAPAGGARIEIEDEGPGLAAAVAARLFQPHVTTKPHGSGMGLFLAHRIASGRYGGELALEPRGGGDGATGLVARLTLGARRAGER